MADSGSPGTIARAALDLGCRSVAFTYNDPVIFMEYAMDIADACRDVGIRSVAVTAGYIEPEPRAQFFSHLDAANVDLKCFSERFYKKLCTGQLAPVLDTLDYIANQTDVWLELTTLLIPGENDSDEELDAMTTWVVEHLGADVPMHFTTFHPDFKMLGHERTPPATLTRARSIARDNCVHHAYTGNVHDARGESPYCAGCGERMIWRDWYELREYRLTDDGLCTNCGMLMAGVFDGPAGDRGGRRIPIRLADHTAA